MSSLSPTDKASTERKLNTDDGGGDERYFDSPPTVFLIQQADSVTEKNEWVAALKASMDCCASSSSSSFSASHSRCAPVSTCTCRARVAQDILRTCASCPSCCSFFRHACPGIYQQLACLACPRREYQPFGAMHLYAELLQSSKSPKTVQDEHHMYVLSICLTLERSHARPLLRLGMPIRIPMSIPYAISNQLWPRTVTANKGQRTGHGLYRRQRRHHHRQPRCVVRSWQRSRRRRQPQRQG